MSENMISAMFLLFMFRQMKLKLCLPIQSKYLTSTFASQVSSFYIKPFLSFVEAKHCFPLSWLLTVEDH